MCPVWEWNSQPFGYGMMHRPTEPRWLGLHRYLLSVESEGPGAEDPIPRELSGMRTRRNERLHTLRAQGLSPQSLPDLRLPGFRCLGVAGAGGGGVGVTRRGAGGKGTGWDGGQHEQVSPRPRGRDCHYPQFTDEDSQAQSLTEGRTLKPCSPSLCCLGPGEHQHHLGSR